VFESGHQNDSAYVISEDRSGDAGGLTKWGIDAKDHPGVDIENLTLEQATQIYHDEEWTSCRCASLPAGIDTAVFDCAVNMGGGMSIILLQRTLQKLGYGIEADGQIGPITIAATVKQAQIDSRGLISGLLAARRSHYQAIAASNPNDMQFLAGWLNRVNDLATFLKGGAC
jgi:lysozyme family protein